MTKIVEGLTPIRTKTIAKNMVHYETLEAVAQLQKAFDNKLPKIDGDLTLVFGKVKIQKGSFVIFDEFGTFERVVTREVYASTYESVNVKVVQIDKQPVKEIKK